MHKSTRRTYLLLTVLLVVLAFGAGMGFMQLFNRASMFQVAGQLVQNVPGLLKVEDAPLLSTASDLRPLQTFWEVREKVKSQFVYEINDDKKLTYGAIRGMLSALEDPYTRFYTPKEYREFQVETEGHFDGIGAVLESRVVDESGRREVFITSVLPEGPASETDIQPEDVIIAVDGKPTRGMNLRQVVNRIRGKRGTEVTLKLRREAAAEPVKVTIVRAEIEVPVVEQRILEDNIGYIWLRSFNKQARRKLQDALRKLMHKDVDGLVLDLSINGGGLLDMAVEVSNMFISGGPVVYIKERGREPEPLNARKATVVPQKVPLVVLVDGASASASEIVAACIKERDRGTVVGQRTFGKAKVQTVSELNDGSALVISTAVYLTPDKNDISKKDDSGERGVRPDRVFQKPDLEEGKRIRFETWHEQQIEKATKVLKEQIAKDST